MTIQGYAAEQPLRLLAFGRRGGFVAAAFAFAVTMLATTLPTPLYPLYRSELGLSELMITVVFASYAAGTIAALLLAGSLSDRVGRRPVCWAGTRSRR